MYFNDRQEAGELLAKELNKFKRKPNTIVVALPRGGVVIGKIIAEFLDLPMDLIVPRKIGAPSNPEFAIGAITEDGSGIFNDRDIKNLSISSDYIEEEVNKQKKEAQRRIDLYRGGRKKLNFEGKNILIVDDGIATGLTMIAAIKSAKISNPKSITVAVPVSARDSLEKIKNMADEAICLHVPDFFGAVGAFYQNFSQVEDWEVISLMNN